MAECKKCIHEKVCKYHDEKVSLGISVKEIGHECVDYVDKADVVEVKHGKWKVNEDDIYICASEFVCSNCNESFCSSELTDEQMKEMLKYCPNCGAKMDGGDKQ